MLFTYVMVEYVQRDLKLMVSFRFIALWRLSAQIYHHHFNFPSWPYAIIIIRSSDKQKKSLQRKEECGCKTNHHCIGKCDIQIQICYTNTNMPYKYKYAIQIKKYAVQIKYDVQVKYDIQAL